MFTFVPPFSETNCVPSMAVFHDPNKGVFSQQQTVPASQPHYNGLKLDDLREMSDLYGRDKISQFAIASKSLETAVHSYKKSGLHSAYAKSLTSKNKK